MKNNSIVKCTIFLLLVCSTIISCNMLDGDEPKLLGSLNIEKRNFNISVYYIPSNATSQSYVQIRKIYKDKREEVYKNLERYQGISKIKIVNDSLFSIIVLDTISYKPRIDTMIIKY